MCIRDRSTPLDACGEQYGVIRDVASSWSGDFLLSQCVLGGCEEAPAAQFDHGNWAAGGGYAAETF